MLASNDVSITTNSKSPNPSDAANIQFLSPEGFLLRKSVVSLYCGFAVYCNNAKAPKSSVVWSKSKDNAYIQLEKEISTNISTQPIIDLVEIIQMNLEEL